MLDSPIVRNADDAMKRLRSRFIAALVAIGILAALGLLVVQALLAGGQNDAHVVGVARGQSMLAERMAKAGRRLTGVSAPAMRRAALDELRDALSSLQRAHAGLQNGDDGMALPGGNSSRVTQLFANLEHDYVAVTADAAKVLSSPESQGDLYQAVQRLDDNAAAFAGGMNAIVGVYEAEAAKRIVWSRVLGLILGLATLALIAAVFRLILEPEFVRLRRELREQETNHGEMGAIFAAGPLPLFAVDAAGLAIEHANQAAIALIACQADDVGGRPLSSHFDSGLEINKSFLKRVRAGEGFDELPVLFVDAQNKAVDALASLRKLSHGGRDRYLISLAGLRKASNQG
jgi:hypothetical protein